MYFISNPYVKGNSSKMRQNLIHTRQIHSLLGIWRGRQYYMKWALKNGKGLKRLRWGWGPRIPETAAVSFPAQQLFWLLRQWAALEGILPEQLGRCSGQDFLFSSLSSFYIVKYLGQSSGLGKHLLYSHTPHLNCDPRLPVQQDTADLQREGSSSQASPHAFHCLSLGSSIKLSDDQIDQFFFFGKLRSNTFSVQDNITIVV